MVRIERMEGMQEQKERKNGWLGDRLLRKNGGTEDGRNVRAEEWRMVRWATKFLCLLAGIAGTEECRSGRW